MQAYLQTYPGSLGQIFAHQCVPQGKVEGSLEFVIPDGHQVKETWDTLGTTWNKTHTDTLSAIVRVDHVHSCHGNRVLSFKSQLTWRWWRRHAFSILPSVGGGERI